MENSVRDKVITIPQWKLIPPERFLSTLEAGQYAFSKRSTSEVIPATASEKLHKLTIELNQSIDKLINQPGGGDHPALYYIWNRLDKKIIKEFDLYMKVVDRSQHLNFPKGTSFLDVSPALGLMYSKTVIVPINNGVIDNLQVAPGKVHMWLDQDNLQPEPEVIVVSDGEADSQPAVSVVPALEKDEVADPQPVVNVEPGLEQDDEAGLQAELEPDVDSGLDDDGDAEPQRVPEDNEFPPLTPLVGGMYEQVTWPKPSGMQAMEVEENKQLGTSKAPEVVRLVGCNIQMLRLEDMVEPGAMAAYWQKYNESKKLTEDVVRPNPPLKSILKSKSSLLAQKKTVRFQLNVEKEMPTCQNNVQSTKRRCLQKRKYKLEIRGTLTRSAHKKHEEKKKLRFSGILLEPDSVDQARVLRSRLFKKAK